MFFTMEGAFCLLWGRLFWRREQTVGARHLGIFLSYKKNWAKTAQSFLDGCSASTWCRSGQSLFRALSCVLREDPLKALTATPHGRFSSTFRKRRSFILAEQKVILSCQIKNSQMCSMNIWLFWIFI
jgi:hypothetical protein